MPIFTFKFPEMERVPVEQRAEIARRCNESPELKQLRKRWSHYTGLASAGTVAVALAVINLSFKVSAVVSIVWALVLAMVAITVAIFLKVRAEIRLIRRLLRRELEGTGEWVK